jgi:hypothetical protein
MKRIVIFVALLIALSSSDSFAQHHGGGSVDNGNRKDPATAALLSIQPLPVDLGNFYTGNWKRGILYTTAELALFIPARDEPKPERKHIKKKAVSMKGFEKGDGYDPQDEFVSKMRVERQ